MVRSRAGQTGVALIEFALVLPLLLAIAVGIVYYGYAYVLKAAVESAAQNAAQEAVALSPLGDNYSMERVLERAKRVALASLPSGIEANVSVASQCEASDLFGVHVRIDLSDEGNTVLPQFELGQFKIPPRPTVIESYACASI